MDDKFLKSETEYLFARKWDDDLPEEVSDDYIDRADNLIAKYGWPKVFEAWNEYLHTKCPTPESVVNFANLYWSYCGDEYPIAEPHKFLGYLLYSIDCRMFDYDNGDIIEGLAHKILSRAGYSEADLYLNPYYRADQDPKILTEVEALRHQNH